MEYIQVLREEYEELKRKAELYDTNREKRASGALKTNAKLTIEQRRKAQQASVLARKRNAELKKQAYLSQIAQDAQNIH